MAKTEIENMGYCIICRRNNVSLSDEHVIPDSIGGYYHIHTVCKECNSKLGDNVDVKLLNHTLIKLHRFSKRMRGKQATYLIHLMLKVLLIQVKQSESKIKWCSYPIFTSRYKK